MKKIISTGIAFVAASLALQPACAQSEPNMETRSTRVIFADLDLTTAAGVDTLNRRVQGAAKRLCLWRSSESLDAARRARRCVEEALSGAEVKIAQAVDRSSLRRYAAKNSIRLSAK